MVDRIRYPTVSYLPFYYVFFQFLLLTIFNLQANILTTKDILSNLALTGGLGVPVGGMESYEGSVSRDPFGTIFGKASPQGGSGSCLQVSAAGGLEVLSVKQRSVDPRPKEPAAERVGRWAGQGKVQFMKANICYMGNPKL